MYPNTAAPGAMRNSRYGAEARLVEGHRRFGDVAAFILPLLLPLESTAGGQLFLPEVVLLLALPFLYDDACRRGVRRVSHTAIVLGGLWLFALVFTDVYRGTSFHDYSRGWANVAFFLVDFAGLSFLIDGRWRRVSRLAAGLAVGEVLQFFFNPNSFAAGEPWKFGYGTAVTLAGVLVASRPSVYRSRVAAECILIAFGVINLTLGFRSLAGICVLSAVLVMLTSRSERLVRRRRRALRTATMLAASVAAGVIVANAYGYAASHGLLGMQAQQKYSAQNGSLGVLVGGRPEIITEALAIRDSPIVGHGSWAKDPKYALALQADLTRAGYPSNEVDTTSGLIPAHSYLFGAWVDGGVLGAVFWFWVFALAGSILVRLHRLRDGRVVLVGFLDCLFLWAILFSPLGAEARLTAAFSLVVVLMAQKEIRAGAVEAAPQ